MYSVKTEWWEKFLINQLKGKKEKCIRSRTKKKQIRCSILSDKTGFEKLHSIGWNSLAAFFIL